MGKTPRVGLESSILDACIEEAIRKPYAGVFGCPNFGFNETSLDALLRLPHMEEIWFWDIDLQDVEAVFTLKRLKYRHGNRGIDALKKLDFLSVWHYSPKNKAFGEILLPQHLTELQINWAYPKTLDGLNSAPNLRRLEIHRCRNLESLALIPVLFPNLEHLVVSTCGRITEEEGRRIIADLPELKHAFIQKIKLV